MIFDDSFSAIDKINKKTIVDNLLSNNSVKNTKIFITHNVGLAPQFEKILFLDNKKAYLTTHKELLNNKNYKLDIDENTEDELSILKNEIYKITVMLKENAENSIKDKINLKNSLSDISHQLKTPLTSITIMLDNILENPNMDSTIRNEFIKDIKRQIININFLVASLLKLSSIRLLIYIPISLIT